MPRQRDSTRLVASKTKQKREFVLHLSGGGGAPGRDVTGQLIGLFCELELLLITTEQPLPKEEASPSYSPLAIFFFFSILPNCGQFYRASGSFPFSFLFFFLLIRCSYTAVTSGFIRCLPDFDAICLQKKPSNKDGRWVGVLLSPPVCHGGPPGSVHGPRRMLI